MSHPPCRMNYQRHSSTGTSIVRPTHLRIGFALSCLLLALVAFGSNGKVSRADGAKRATAARTTVNGVQVTPAQVTLPARGGVQFTAEVTGLTDQRVSWSVNGNEGGAAAIGTISTSGLYTAPNLPPDAQPVQFIIRATSLADASLFGEATVTVTGSGSQFLAAPVTVQYGTPLNTIPVFIANPVSVMFGTSSNLIPAYTSTAVSVQYGTPPNLTPAYSSTAVSVQYGTPANSIPAAVSAPVSVRYGTPPNIFAAYFASPLSVSYGDPLANCTPPPSGMVAWYPAEGNANDIQGNNNGTLQNGTQFETGKVGQAFSFDGVNDYVQIPRLIQDDFTIEFWMRTTQTGGSGSGQWYNGFGLVDAEVATVVNDFGVTLGNGKALFGTGNPDTTIRSTSAVNDGGWHQIAATRIRSTGALALYVDGAQVATGTGGTQSLTSPANISFGRVQTVQYYNGLLDEPTLYNRALSPSQIQAIYNAGSAGKCKPESLTSLALNPTSVVGGRPSTATVTLGAGAPTGGAVVQLASSNSAVASVPPSVIIAEGNSSASFMVTTSAVPATTTADISATYNGVTKAGTLTINPNALPAVGITSPTAGATFDAPATIPINATASDPDGTISKVDFYANGSLIGSATTSPYSFTWDNVTANSYTLIARATDDLGLTTASSPISVSVVASDTTPPNTVLTGGPGEGASLCTGTALFSFTGSDDITPVANLSYRWRLDDDAWQGPISATTVTLNNLTGGAHRFEVAAVDARGNIDPTPAARNFNVDASAPVIANVRATQVGAAVAGILWGTNENATSQVEYRLLGEPAWDRSTEDVRYVTQHGVPLVWLRPDNAYEYRVRSRDNCGREAVSDIYSFHTTADAESPDTSITTGPRNGGAVQPGPVIFAWAGVDNATRPERLRYQYQLDENVLTPTEPQTFTTVTLNGLALGSHMFKVYATDEAGNIDATPAIVQFTVDATAPGVTSLFVNDITYVSARVHWTTDEPTSGTVQYALSDGDFVYSYDDPSLNTTHALNIGPLASDTAYRVRVLARDEAGNQLVSQEVTFTSAKLRDLSLVAGALSFSNAGPAAGDSITMTAVVRNSSDLASSATLVFYDATQQTGSREISRHTISVPAHAPDVVITSLPFPVGEGLHTPYAQLVNITPGDDISGNNTARTDLLVAAPPARFTLSVANPHTWPGNDSLFTAVVKNTGASPQALSGAQVTGVSWVTLASTLPAAPLGPGEEAQLTFRMTPPTSEPGGTVANPVRVPVVLSVAGAQAPSLSFTIELFAGPVRSLDVTVIDATARLPIRGATLALDNTDRQWITGPDGKPVDENGQPAFVGIAPGTQTVHAAASGYTPNSVSTDGLTPVVLTLTAGRGLEIVDVRVRELTPAEVAARGVNLQDPQNFWVFDFVLYMRIGPLPIYNVILPRAPGVGYTVSGGCACGGGGGGGGGVPINVQYQFVYTSPTERRETWIIIPGDIRILKQFWEATVLVRNATDAPISNVRASLDVPTGLALPELFGQQQQQTQFLGTIPARENRQAQWIVRGDRAGRYRLTGRAAGDGVPNVSLQSNEFEVVQPKLRVTFDTPTSVVAGGFFDIGINIRNDSPIDLQGVQVNIHADRLVNCELADTASKQIGTIAVGETKSVTFRFISHVTGYVLEVRSYVSLTPLEPPVEVVPGPAPPPPPPVIFPRDVLISEFRLRGPNGAHDEFVELYNNTDANIRVGTFDGSAGWTLAGLEPDGASATPKFVIPNDTIIPARGHYLATNSSSSGGPYSLGPYAAGDLTYTNDLADNSGIALFRTAAPANLTATTLLDAVGFAGPAGTVANLYREGAGLTVFDPGTAEHSWVRRLATGVPQDTNNNAVDFVLISTTGGTFGGSGASMLGAPGPENALSPVQRNAQFKASLIEPQQLSSAAPNRVRDATATGPNAQFGTLDIRRRFTNRTGQVVTRLRFRVVDITTLNTPNPGGAQADLRLLDSTSLSISTSRGLLTVRGTFAETPPTQAFGGGLNTTAGVVALPGGLAPNATVDVRFLLGVQAGGSFRFLVNVEALTGSAASPTQKGHSKLKPTH